MLAEFFSIYRKTPADGVNGMSAGVASGTPGPTSAMQRSLQSARSRRHGMAWSRRISTESGQDARRLPYFAAERSLCRVCPLHPSARFRSFR